MTRPPSWIASVALLLAGAPVAARDRIPRDLSVAETIEYLKSGGEDARREACKRLGDRRERSAAPHVGALVLKDPSVRVRISCVKALEEMGPNAVAAAYVREAVLKDPDPKMRQEALDALADVDPGGAGAVAAQVLLRDKERAVRKQACRAIERRRWASADAAAIKVVTDPTEREELRRACLQAVVAIGSSQGYAVAHKMMTEAVDVDLRKEASAQIEHHPRPSSLPFLCKALYDSNHHLAANAVNGLRRLGRKEGAACLREAARAVRSDRLAGNMNKVAGELER